MCSLFRPGSCQATSRVPSGLIQFCSSSPTRSVGALLIRQYSKTPSLRSKGFEDSPSDEAKALQCRPLKSASQARRAPQPGRWRSRKDDDENEYEAPYLLTARIKDELCRFHW